MKNETERLYLVASPDGFYCDPSWLPMPMEELREYFIKWKKRYETQGYYSSNNGRIALVDLELCCEYVLTNNEANIVTLNDVEYYVMESIGAAVNTSTGVAYPILKNGVIDLDEDVSADIVKEGLDDYTTSIIVNKDYKALVAIKKMVEASIKN